MITVAIADAQREAGQPVGREENVHRDSKMESTSGSER